MNNVDTEWYDDRPMYTTPAERALLELSQLGPTLDDWGIDLAEVTAILDSTAASEGTS
jgi:hypothetical protein